MSLSGDIRDGHLRIGEWSAERQPGTGGVHPYRWGVKLSSGPLVRGVVVHDREDGTLGLVIKVLTAAVQQFGDRDHPEVPTAQAEPGHALAADVAARGYRERAERAEAARDQLREEARRFAEALGFGDGRTERAATLAELVDPLTQAMSDSREHQECPVFCELCGERLAGTSCEACRGSGCLPNAEMAYLECGECAGVGKVHTGCVEQPYAALAATLARVRETAEHYDGLTGVDAAAAILRVLDGAS